MLRYYQILGLSSNATQGQIKRAYRQKAMQYHPDRNQAPGARQKFLEVLEAYEFLTGARKPSAQQQQSNPESDFETIMRDLARKKAREKYRQRVYEFRRKQAEEQSKEFVRAIYVLMSLLTLGGSYYVGKKLYDTMYINNQPAESYATVYTISPRRVDFSYSYKDMTYREHGYASKTKSEMKTGVGMPISPGDQFAIRFAKDAPERFRIHYHRPSPRTLQRYLAIVGFKIIKQNQESWEDLSFEERINVSQFIARRCYNEMGIEALSQLYYSDTFFLENMRHNSVTWFFFKHFSKYQNIEEAAMAMVDHPQ